jgi:hypothetical protein
LWGDSDNEEEDNLPSPLPRLKYANTNVLSTVATMVDSSSAGDSMKGDPGVSSHAAGPMGVDEFMPIPHGNVGNRSGIAAHSVDHSIIKDLGSQMVLDRTDAELETHASTVVVKLNNTGNSPVPYNACSVGQENMSVFSCELTHTTYPTEMDHGDKGLGAAGDINKEFVKSASKEALTQGTFQHLVQEPVSPMLVSNVDRLPDAFLVLSQGKNKCPGTGVFLGGRLTTEEAEAFGGISSPLKGMRSSSRISLQDNADDTQMVRAQKLAKAKDEATGMGARKNAVIKPPPIQGQQHVMDKGPCSGTVTPSKYSLQSFSEEVFIDRAYKLGVSLGSSPSKVSNMIKKIKDDDHSRTIIMLTKNLVDKDSEGGLQQNEVFDRANALTTDFIDESKNLGQGELEPNIQETKIIKVYKRRDKVKPKVVRRSSRLNKNKCLS